MLTSVLLQKAFKMSASFVIFNAQKLSDKGLSMKLQQKLLSFEIIHMKT